MITSQLLATGINKQSVERFFRLKDSGTDFFSIAFNSVQSWLESFIAFYKLLGVLT